MRHFVCITLQYLIREVTILNEGPLLQGCVYVLTGGWVPINLLYYTLYLKHSYYSLKGPSPVADMCQPP